MHSFDAASRSAICFFSITYSNVLSIPLVQPTTEHCFRIRFYIRLCVVFLTSQSGLMLPFLDAWMDFNFPVCVRWTVTGNGQRATGKISSVFHILFQSWLGWWHGLSWDFFTHAHTKTQSRQRTHDVDVIRFPNGILEFCSCYLSFIHPIVSNIHL